MKDKIISILLNPFVISSIISIIIISFLPEYFPKYEIKYIKDGVFHKERIAYFFDLDGDNISEQIICGESSNGNAYFQVFDLNGSIIDQWNFYGKFPSDEKKI